MSENLHIQTELQYLDSLSRNLLNGYLFRFHIDAELPKNADEFDACANRMQCVYLSYSWENISNIPRELVIQDFRLVFEMFHPDDLPCKVTKFYNCLANGTAFDEEMRYKAGNGEMRWIQFTTQPRREGDVIVCDGFALDITSRKQTELELKSERGWLQSINYNLNTDGALYRLVYDTTTGERRMTYLSDNWGHITGIRNSAALEDERMINETIHPDDQPFMLALEQKSLEEMSNFNCEVRIASNDAVQWVQLISHPHRVGNLVVWDGIMYNITERKQMEQNLLAEKKHLEALSSNLPSCALFRLVLDTPSSPYRVTYLSANWENIVGVSIPDALHDFGNTFKVMHTADVQRFIEHEHECLKHIRNFQCEVRLYVSGEWRWVMITAHPHIENEYLAWDGLVLDVTERKQIEQQLLKQNNRLEELGNNLHNGSLIRCEIDADELKRLKNPAGILEILHMTYASNSWGKTSGVPKEEAMKDINLVLKKIHEDDQPALFGEIYCAIAERRAMDMEVRYNYSSSEMRWIRISVSSRDEGEKIVCDGFILNITRQKTAEQQVIEKSNHIEELGNNLHNGSLVRCEIDADELKRLKSPADILEVLHITYASNSWEKTSGVPKEEAMKDITLVLKKVHEDDQPAFFGKIYCAIAERKAMDMEVRYHYSNSEMRWIRISVSARNEGEMIVCDGFVFNITQRKNIELEMNAYRDKLELLVQERTAALNTAYEEINTANEELSAMNQELSATNEELALKNIRLSDEMCTNEELIQLLEDSEEKMRCFVDQSIDGILMYDYDGNIIGWNNALERITGIATSNALGRQEWELRLELYPEHERTPEQLDRLRQNRLEYIGGETKPDTQDLTLYTTNGIRYVRASIFKIITPNRKFIGRIIRDITRYRHAEMELANYRANLEMMVNAQTEEILANIERLTTLSNNLPGGIIYQMQDLNDSADARFTYANARFSEIFGIDEKELLNDPGIFFQFLHPDDVLKFKTIFAEAGSNGVVETEFRAVLSESHILWIHLRTAYRTDNKGVRTWDGFMIDITDKKNTMLELEESRRRQNFIIRVLQTMQNIDDIQQAVNSALTEIGTHVWVGRVFIFEIHSNGNTGRYTYEWCNEDVTPYIDRQQEDTFDKLANWFNIFRSGGYINAPDIRTLPAAEYDTLNAQGLKSILAFPLKSGNDIIGFIGFGCTNHPRKWIEKGEIDLLGSLAHIFTSGIRRHRAEINTKVSHQTMRTVLDNISANIYVADMKSHKVLFANKALRNAMGSDIESKHCWKLIRGKEAGPCDTCPGYLSVGGNSKFGNIHHWEYLNEKNGRWYDSTDSIIEWIDGSYVHLQYATDITERRQAAERLHRSEEMYRRLTEASSDAIMTTDAKGNVTYVSTQLRNYFKVDADTDVSELYVMDFVHPHKIKACTDFFKTVLRDSVAFAPEMYLKRKDNSDFFGELSAAAVKNAAGNIDSIITVIRDITDRKRYEAELIQAKEHAEESDRLKSSFLSNLSHEVRTPVNIISGFVTALKPQFPPEFQELADSITANTVRLTQMIDEVVDAAKIETGQMVINRQPVWIDSLMTDMYNYLVTKLQTTPNKAHIAAEYVQGSSIGTATVDAERLKQVLTCLLNNAITFTDNGSIGISCSYTSAATLEFYVKDTGIGIPNDRLNILFQRFRQVDTGNNRRYEGIGLGLSISRGLVQLMGGDIKVASTVGRGSTFTFTIKIN